MGASVLCQSDAERGALVDRSRRLRRATSASAGLFLAAGVVGTSTFGWAPLVPMAVVAIVFRVLRSRLSRLRRPEYAMAATWLCAEAMTAVAVAVATGPREYMLSMFVFPVMVGSVTYPTRIVAAGAGMAATLTAAVGLLCAGDTISASPPTLVYPIVTLLCTALWASATRSADDASRGTAIVDQLTGLLNRSALAARVAELSHQGGSAEGRVALVVGDLDRFKAINDEHGHAAGDRVLREVAARLRASLDAFGSAYRLGGEEFAILLPGAGAPEAACVAERLRLAVAATPIAGLTVSISFGVAASHPGDRFDYNAVFARADQALYRAKRGGRDRVCVEEIGAASDMMPAPATRPKAMATGADTAPRARPRGDGAPGAGGTWLAQDDVYREHMLDVLRRIDLVGHAGNALVLGALVAATPWFGWLPIVPAVIGGALLQIVESSLQRFRRPEYALAAAWVLACVGNAAAFLVARTPPLAALPLLTLMIVGFSAVFPARAVLAGGALQAILMIGVAHGIAGPRLLDDPGILAYPLALLGSVAFIGAAVGRSAIEHRGAAVVDRLTGMLNRTALESRIPQLAHEARVTGEPVAVVVADLDHFKAFNDRHGHAVGDGVLREVARRLRTELRAFDSAYRFGGEEFLVLLPGLSAATALEVADRMRDVVRAEPVAGLPVTVSLGVAASAPGEPCDFEQLFARADRALYEAKHAGRDRIASARAVAMPLAI